MGYNTDFKGVLKFKTELTASQLAKVKSFLGEDCRDHPEWECADDMTYVDLLLLDDFTGLKWDDGTEKTYDLVEKVNLITTIMRKEYPEFCLTGKLLAQGEDIDDRWELVINDAGMASKKDLPQTGDKITCPHCEEHFYI